ncbi:MAG: translation initiation factor IF-2 [Deltaproteobacteria bacterium]|nr:translation initiation factor IF-2 [Deltaproteobacteria bacterium]MBW2413969.1 translation initiation factor IF-2 [Deltaproteobacteria bacterium]
MAKLRAYKLAEELRLEPDEFLKKAKTIGIELRSKMASLDDDQVDEIRRRLGVGLPEQRVEKRVGRSVIRRRKRVDPVPAAEPEAAADATPQLESEPGAEPVAAQEAPAVAVEEAAAADEAEAVESTQPEPEIRPQPAPVPAPASASAAAAAAAQRPVGKRPARREANLAANLKEQDTLARTMLGNVQHRLEQRRSIVEQQSRINPRKRRAAAGRKTVRPSEPSKKIVRLTGEISLPEFSRQSGVKLRDVHRRVRQLGTEVERDGILDVETAQLLSEDLGVELELAVKDVEGDLTAAARDDSTGIEPRPPVVTVMGHVDHGKTSLLDTLRDANVVAGEAGGITQHIGAYQVEAGGRKITFIDTPGHAAFTSMRARGAQVTDIVVLVVSADDGVMPQTVEAISHARASGAPLVVAINKIDLPNANPQRAKQALLEHEVVLEEFGGDVQHAEISATLGTNIDGLLEQLNLQAEILDLRARATGPGLATVIEAQLDKGRGPLATVLIREGKLAKGDVVVAGKVFGRVRSMLDEHGDEIKQAGPATPVQIVGLGAVPEAGDELVAVKNEREAKSLIEHRQVESLRAGAAVEESELISAEDLFATLGDSDEKELRVLIKADVRGTSEAVRDALEKLSTEKVKVNVLGTLVGAITESDVILASASDAVILGFHARPDSAARKLAEAERVEVRLYELIHELLDDVTALMSGLLPPKVEEKISGTAEVRQLFVIPRVGTVAGSAVVDGSMLRSNLVRVVRDGVSVYSGKVASLKHFKDDVREVQSPRECGLRIENFNDLKIGDTLESYLLEETPDTI